MDKRDNYLNPSTQKPYHPAIQAAMKLACNKINRYYSLTDLSSAYRIAMGKFNYILCILCLSADILFSPSSRTQTRIFPTKGMGRRVDRHGRRTRPQSIRCSIRGKRRCGQHACNGCKLTIQFVYIVTLIVLQVDSDSDNDFTTFANISMTKQAGSRPNELREYLRKPAENVKDPLKWWIASRHTYPNLYRMALDYLSIPGKSFIISLLYVANSTLS